MENYICINGNKTELTEEQLKQLGIKEVKVKENNHKRNNPFDRVNGGYYCIKDRGEIYNYDDVRDPFDNMVYNNINYFNNKDFANQVYLHELLNRKLLKYSWDNKAEDNLEWNWCYTDENNKNYHYFIYKTNSGFKVGTAIVSKGFNVYFSKYDVAERAIKDVVKPFMEKYPEFEW